MAITIPNTFVAATIAEAAEVNGNFTAVKNFVDSLQAGTNFNAGAIQTAAIADASLTTSKFAVGAIQTAAIADGAVTTAKIADASVTTVKIADGSITNAKLASVVSGDSDQIVLGVQLFL